MSFKFMLCSNIIKKNQENNVGMIPSNMNPLRGLVYSRSVLFIYLGFLL